MQTMARDLGLNWVDGPFKVEIHYVDTYSAGLLKVEK